LLERTELSFDLFLSEGDEHKRGVAVYINEQLKAEELKIVNRSPDRRRKTTPAFPKKYLEQKKIGEKDTSSLLIID
jgi:hypothetical protein